MSGTLTIGGMSAGLPSGYIVIGPVTTTGNSASLGEVEQVTLNSGDNTFAVPAGAVSVAIFMGSSPSATVKFRTNLNIADVGTSIAPAPVISWFKKDIVSGETSIVLNANGTVTGVGLTFI